MTLSEKTQNEAVFDTVADLFEHYKELERPCESRPGFEGVPVPISDESAAILVLTHMQTLANLRAVEPPIKEDGSNQDPEEHPGKITLRKLGKMQRVVNRLRARIKKLEKSQ